MTRISIIVAAYNEGGSIAAVLEELKESLPQCETVVVDDGSSDDTFAVARGIFPNSTLRHNFNRGQGAALKTGIRHATGDFVILVDGDGQHPLEAIRAVVARVLEDPSLDAVFTERDNLYSSGNLRSIGKFVINRVVHSLTGQKIRDVNCGLRAFRRKKIVPFLFQFPDAFSFSTTSTVLGYMENFRIGWVRISMAKRQSGTSQLRARHALNTVVLVFRLIVLFDPLRFFVPLSAYAFLFGMLSIAYSMLTSGGIGKNYIFLFLFGSLAFIMGLLSEQIANLRKEMVTLKNDR